MEPFNRHVLIKLIEKDEEQKESLVVLPTDYKKPEAPYLIGEVLDWAEDCKIQFGVSDEVVFEKRMLQKIEIDDKLYYLILENYIFGRI
tara:strand:+ start:848 stop:1114 length:267 start_codon:yes stop_codon:yes gene_type:complete